MSQSLDAHIKFFLCNILAEHVGHENRIKRSRLKEELCFRLNANVSDRKMRDMLEELRLEKRGCWIVGSLRSGYFSARDKEELRQHLAKDKKRISNMSRRVRAQEMYADLENPDQLRLADALVTT